MYFIETLYVSKLNLLKIIFFSLYTSWPVNMQNFDDYLLEIRIVSNYSTVHAIKNLSYRMKWYFVPRILSKKTFTGVPQGLFLSQKRVTLLHNKHEISHYLTLISHISSTYFVRPTFILIKKTVSPEKFRLTWNLNYLHLHSILVILSRKKKQSYQSNSLCATDKNWRLCSFIFRFPFHSFFSNFSLKLLRNLVSQIPIHWDPISHKNNPDTLYHSILTLVGLLTRGFH